MNILRALGRGLIFLVSLFNNYLIRGIISLEFFVLFVLLPLHSHIGIAPTKDFVLQHRMIFYWGIPAFNALLGLVLGSRAYHELNAKGWKKLGWFAAASIALNAAFIMVLSSMWPE